MNLTKAWYQRRKWLYLLWPLSMLYRIIIFLRKYMYKVGLKSVQHFSPLVIVVGNVVVGGTGKSPMVSYLAKLLTQQGLRVGLISRGYKGKARSWPQIVCRDSDPVLVGDEAVMLVQQTGCVMAVGPDRPAALAALLQKYQLDCIISDDGLQHHALGRDLEIIMMDAQRGIGNGMLLPAGPLREPSQRLQQEEFLVMSGEGVNDHYHMQLVPAQVVHLLTGQQRSLAEFAEENIAAMAGIGHPEKYFTLLDKAGLQFESYAFADHHRYAVEDLNKIKEPVILMTAKDAVKCQSFADARCWAVHVDAQVSAEFEEQLQIKVKQLLRSHST